MRFGKRRGPCPHCGKDVALQDNGEPGHVHLSKGCFEPRHSPKARKQRVVHASRDGVAMCNHKIKVEPSEFAITCKTCLGWVGGGA